MLVWTQNFMVSVLSEQVRTNLGACRLSSSRCVASCFHFHRGGMKLAPHSRNRLDGAWVLCDRFARGVQHDDGQNCSGHSEGTHLPGLAVGRSPWSTPCVGEVVFLSRYMRRGISSRRHNVNGNAHTRTVFSWLLRLTGFVM